MKSFAFKKNHRLLTTKDYQLAFDAIKDNRGIKITHACFRILVAENTLQHPRLGLVMTKKSIKKAVDRNRIKRIVREQFRTWRVPIEGDMIVMASRECIKFSNAELRKALEEIWKKLYQQQQKI